MSIKNPPLVFEHLENDLNYIFLTLIEFKRIKYLTIIENIVEDEIHAYILDNLQAEGIDYQWFMSIAIRWFYKSSDKYPLSFEFAKIGQGEIVKKVLKTFNINSASRVIGKFFVYNTHVKPKTRRRKVQQVVQLESVKFK